MAKGEDVSEENEEGGGKDSEDKNLSKYMVVRYLTKKFNLRMTNGAKVKMTEITNLFVNDLLLECIKPIDSNKSSMIRDTDVFMSLESRGFQNYVEEISNHSVELKIVNKRKRKMENSLTKSGLSEKELIEQQQRLFNEARLNRQKSLKSMIQTETNEGSMKENK